MDDNQISVASLIISLVSAAAAVVSVYFTRKSFKLSENSLKLNKELATDSLKSNEKIAEQSLKSNEELTKQSLDLNKKLAAESLESNKKIAEQSLQLNKNLSIGIFKRQGVIDLYAVWNNVNLIDPNNIIVPHVVNALHALQLTAAFWNHDIVDKTIIVQTYWNDYKNIYDSLDKINNIISGINMTGKALLTDDITKAYKGMEKRKIGDVQTSKLNS